MGKAAIFSFSALAKSTNLSKEELDKALRELEADRFITEFVLESDDDFLLILHPRAVQALTGESLV